MSGSNADPGFDFDNSYQRLPDRFYARIAPTAVSAPRLIKLNTGLADLLGLNAAALASPEGLEMLAGNRVPSGAEPIAMAYAGHQFGGFVPQLGDGRAILLGEVVGRDGLRRDIQLKGSGPTPFSRRGDGRAALGSVVREYIVSEAMAALGIPTTRALAAVATGDYVFREEPMPGAVLTRVARSHIRVGTFQFFAVRDDVEGLGLLADHAIERLYPELKETEQPYLPLLEAVAERQSALVASWLLVGFIHGVMNTDNMSIAGETIDYGPCAFMDAFDPATVFSSIDQMGRYAYGNQPSIAQWNLARFAETLLPLIDAEQEKAVAAAMEILDRFPERFMEHYGKGLRAKFGLQRADDRDGALMTEFLGLMRSAGADFTLSFRRLADVVPSDADPYAIAELFKGSDALASWLDAWRSRLALERVSDTEIRQRLHGVNPLYIPRNHLVEAAINSAVDREDFTPVETLMEVLLQPFQAQTGRTRYSLPPEPHEVVHETFCGT
jgi:uncharacterized protein YdiU (UPF0061 family)